MGSPGGSGRPRPVDSPAPPWPLVTCHVTRPQSELPGLVTSHMTGPQADLESGSEISSIAGLGAVSKEQMLQSYQRMRAKYNKYRGRYTDLARAFHSLENENEKMRVSQEGCGKQGGTGRSGRGPSCCWCRKDDVSCAVVWKH